MVAQTADACVTQLNILLVEDHAGLRAAIQETLEAAGHLVTGVDCAEDVSELTVYRAFDVAVVDYNLPGENGLSLVTRLRASCPRMGIVMVTVRDSIDDKMRGYEVGADLYLTKPVDAKELLFAISALARRLQPSTQAVAKYHLNLGLSRLATPAGEVIKLTRREAQVLNGLALAFNGHLESWQLLEILQQTDSERAKQNLEVLISRLRSKLRAQGIDQDVLQSERSRGYTLTLPVEIS